MTIDARFDICDDCGLDSDTGALCRSCIHDRETDLAEDRRADERADWEWRGGCS